MQDIASGSLPECLVAAASIALHHALRAFSVRKPSEDRLRPKWTWRGVVGGVPADTSAAPVNNEMKSKSPARGRAKPRASIAASVPIGWLDYLEKTCGLDPEAIYPQTLVERIRDFKANEELAESTFIKMFAPAIAATKREDLVLEGMFDAAGKMFGSLVDVITKSPDAYAALGHLMRYNHLTGCLGHFTGAIEEGDQHVVIMWEADEKESQSPHVMEYRLATMAAGIRKICQDVEMPVDISVPYDPPSYADKYETGFGGVVEFNSALCRIVAPSRTKATKPLHFPGAAPETLGDDKAELKNLSADAKYLHHRLTNFILEHLASGKVNLEHAAAYIDVSGRTLQRWLDRSGIHYQELIDQVRMNQAKVLLDRPAVSLSRIAFLLGYTAQTNFQNAFRRWTGISPGDYRNRQQGVTPKVRKTTKPKTPPTTE